MQRGKKFFTEQSDPLTVWSGLDDYYASRTCRCFTVAGCESAEEAEQLIGVSLRDKHPLDANLICVGIRSEHRDPNRMEVTAIYKLCRHNFAGQSPYDCILCGRRKIDIARDPRYQPRPLASEQIMLDTLKGDVSNLQSALNNAWVSAYPLTPIPTPTMAPLSYGHYTLYPKRRWGLWVLLLLFYFEIVFWLSFYPTGPIGHLLDISHWIKFPFAP